MAVAGTSQQNLMTMAVIEIGLELFADFLFCGVGSASSINKIEKCLSAVEAAYKIVQYRRPLDDF